MKILVIEDDPIMTLLLNRILNNFRYQPLFAKDGKEALELINTELPDLVITDMMLPFVSGPEIISYIRNLPGKKIPVILLSSMPLNAQKNNHDNFGANSYLTKPVCPARLKTKIEELRGVELV